MAVSSPAVQHRTVLEIDARSERRGSGMRHLQRPIVICILSLHASVRPCVHRVSDKEFGDLGSHTQAKHAFCGSLSEVQAVLSGFPEVTYCRGWIPESFATVPDRLYKFVRLDLDLYEPIKGALEYFYPRLGHGGVIVVDEYGFPRWPGARKAVDEFCSRHGRAPIGLTTGNGVIVKA